MINNEQTSREELVAIYQKYIDEMAKDALEKKPVNPFLIQASNNIMSQIRDWDIIISMNMQKENKEEINKVI